MHLFFDLIHFRELGQKYRNILVRFLVQMKTLKVASEINWPLARIEMTYSVTIATLSSKGVSGSSKAGRWKAGPKILPKVKIFYLFWLTVTGLANFGFTPLLWLPQGPRAHSRFGHYFCSNLYWRTPRGPRDAKKSEFFFYK